MRICENCGAEHDGSYGSGRFCSTKCARGFSTKAKRKEISERVSKTLKYPPVIKKCSYCEQDFEIQYKKRSQKTCSPSCSTKLKWTNEEYRNKVSAGLSKAAYRRHADPNIKFGWSTRNKFEMSYPERIAYSVLKDNSIEFEREYHFHPYFIDFAIVEHKIAIEIDGQQHNLPERIASDNKKDAKLISNGWTVYRIKWPDDNIIYKIQQILASIPSA